MPAPSPRGRQAKRPAPGPAPLGSHLLKGAQLVVLHHLLEAELQVVEQPGQLLAVGTGELGALERLDPGVHRQPKHLAQASHHVGADAAVAAGGGERGVVGEGVGG